MVAEYIIKEQNKFDALIKWMTRIVSLITIILILFILFGCSYSVESKIPNIPITNSPKYDKSPVLLLISHEFQTYKFNSSNPGAGSYYFNFGSSASKSMQQIVESKFKNVTMINVPGDGDFDFVKYSSTYPDSITLRPRFASVNMRSPLWSIVDMKIALDISNSPSIYGNGSAAIITHGTQPVQYVADTVLRESIEEVLTGLNRRY